MPALTFFAPGTLPTKLVKIVCEKPHNMQPQSPDDSASQFLSMGFSLM